MVQQTSAHTLAYCLILLALYQEEQEKFYQNIKQTLSDGRTPSYEEFSTLSYSMAYVLLPSPPRPIHHAFVR